MAKPRHKWPKGVDRRAPCLNGCGCMKTVIIGQGRTWTVYRIGERLFYRAPICVQVTPLNRAIAAYVKEELYAQT